MVKLRLAIIISAKMAGRPGLCTVVPLSTKPPSPKMPFHELIRIPFDLPSSWGDVDRWIKGDMVNSVGFHRIDLLRLGTHSDGRRIYQFRTLPNDLIRITERCVLHGLGMSSLTKYR